MSSRPSVAKSLTTEWPSSSAERERVERAAAADKLDKQVAAIEAALLSYLEQSLALADALSKIGHGLEQVIAAATGPNVLSMSSVASAASHRSSFSTISAQ
jgi:hypothetical protein